MIYEWQLLVGQIYSIPSNTLQALVDCFFNRNLQSIVEVQKRLFVQIEANNFDYTQKKVSIISNEKFYKHTPSTSLIP